MIVKAVVWLVCAGLAFLWLTKVLSRDGRRPSHHDISSPTGPWGVRPHPEQTPIEAEESPSHPTESELQIAATDHNGQPADRLRELMGLALTAPTPDAVLEFSAFASRLKRFGSYNIMMVYAQRPGASAVGSRREWASVGQTVRPDALPILILQPNGPIAQVFELEDTLPPRDRDPRKDAFAAVGEFKPETLRAMIRNLSTPKKRKLKVDVTFASLGSAYAGWISSQPSLPFSPNPSFQGQRGLQALTPGQLRGHWRVMINSRLTPAEQFSTLLHELGHLFCGHAGAFDQGTPKAYEYGWPDRSHIPHSAKEVEAELVAWHICERWGLVTGSALYLRPYLEDATDEIRCIDLDRVIRAIAKIERFIPRLPPSSNRGS
ncbi:MAG: ImmA/IrrE family metallo-endopeptidase [Blastomonas sp.]|uniref:ImmA/IrrE family metallo-endopeptidase n=1 Tax=Blastomonas sp. TaxID=1909299 RepID=UPI00258C73FE|nr:ImmA/IrrE family metallo-endopeptidase [Blastomonas sp.]MCO5792082.1 ImmA/IrrE family metallo-endopeptidase [Blastomonas sp.]